MIVSALNPALYVTIESDVPFADSVTLRPLGSDPLPCLFVLKNGQLISCLSGLVLQVQMDTIISPLDIPIERRVGQLPAVHTKDRWAIDHGTAIAKMNGFFLTASGGKFEPGARLVGVCQGESPLWCFCDPPLGTRIALPPGFAFLRDPSYDFDREFRRIMIQPTDSELYLTVKLSSGRYRSDSSFVSLQRMSWSASQAFWFDESRGALISCDTRLALSVEAGSVEKPGIVNWVWTASDRQRWRLDRGRLCVGERPLFLATSALEENRPARLTSGEPVHGSRGWTIRELSCPPSRDPLNPSVSSRFDGLRGARAAALQRLREGGDRTEAETAIRLCDCALLCAFIYEYAESPTLRCSGWIPWSDRRIIGELGLSDEEIRRLKAALRPQCGLCAEIFFPVGEDDFYVSPPILVFKGTSGVVVNYDGLPQSVDAADWWDNAVYLFTRTSPYTEAVAAIASILERIARLRLALITGHSLGGRLAADLATRTGKKAITFNAAGFHEAAPQGAADRITNYAVDEDILTWIQRTIQTAASTLKTLIAGLKYIITQIRDLSWIHTAVVKLFAGIDDFLEMATHIDPNGRVVPVGAGEQIPLAAYSEDETHALVQFKESWTWKRVVELNEAAWTWLTGAGRSIYYRLECHKMGVVCSSVQYQVLDWIERDKQG
jgi:pimeloyl-ACP methyl ester carboxylesterase